MIAEYQGLVSVPFFSAGAGWSYAGGVGAWSFGRNSYGPLHRTTGHVTESFPRGGKVNNPSDIVVTVDGLYAIQPAVPFTPATLVLNPGGSLSGLPVNWFDEKIWFQSSGVNPNDPPSLFKAFTPWINKPMGRAPGSYNSIPPYTTTIDEIDGGTNVSYLGEVMPGMSAGSKVAVAFNAFALDPHGGSNDRIGVSVWPGGTVVTSTVQLFPINCSAIQLNNLQWNNNRIIPEIGGFDNIAFFSNNTANAGCRRVLYNGFGTFTPYELPINLSDSFMDTFFQGVATQEMSIYYGGFISRLFTNGAGPTKQPTEFAVFNMDMTKYWLIDVVPQDNFSQNLLAANTSWFLSIDNEGIFWIGSGSVSEPTSLIYSFSPLNFVIPALYSGNLEPLVLPCYNTCSPVPLL